MSKLRWSQRARRDLLAIARYIAADNPPAARRWLTGLRKRARTAARLPRSGRRVPELASDDLRELVIKNYRLIYRPETDGITVLTVFEAHRRVPSDLPE
jgi:plasmid stabilization system protein ParE